MRTAWLEVVLLVALGCAACHRMAAPVTVPHSRATLLWAQGSPIVELVSGPGFRIEQRLGTDDSLTELFTVSAEPRRVMSIHIDGFGDFRRGRDPAVSPTTRFKGVIIAEAIEWLCWQDRTAAGGPFLCETTVPWSRPHFSPSTVLRVLVRGESESEAARYRRLAETNIDFVRQVPAASPDN